MVEGGQDPSVIIVPDAEDDDWPDPGLQNPEEAQEYMDKLVKIFNNFGEMIPQDQKDVLLKTIWNLKKLMAKHWNSMDSVDPEVVIRSIIDPGCLHLCQHMMREGTEAIDPVAEIPKGWQFIRKLPKKVCQKEEQEITISIFDHASEAHAHLLTVSFHAGENKWHAYMNAEICPLVQINVPEKFLNLMNDMVPKTMEEQRMEKLGKTILPLHNAACMKHKPKNGPTHILAAAVWLKLKWKFFNTGMAKEACELFEVCVKQLSKVISGRKYLSGTQKKMAKDCGMKRKSTSSKKGTKKQDDDNGDDGDDHVGAAKKIKSCSN